MHKWIASGMIAMTCAGVFVAFVFQDIRAIPSDTPVPLPWGLIMRYALAMILGGALVGYLLGGAFGHKGGFGWVLGLLSGLFATSLAGLFGSAFGLLPEVASDGVSLTEIIEIAAGLLILPLAASEEPFVLIFVVCATLVTHFLCKRTRQAV